MVKRKKKYINRNELYYFIIDINNEKIVNIIHDKFSKEILTVFDTSDVEKHIQELVNDKNHYVKMSELEISDTIAYPFVFYGINDNHQFIYDWYFFWFNLSENNLENVNFTKIKNNI